MQVRFWGVRGSIPVSGTRFLSTGGNTSCVELEHDGHRLILDGGTGLREFSEQLGPVPVELTIVLSHYHWDHIQGIPFFSQAYNPQSNITIAGSRGHGLPPRELLDRQMKAPNFPVPLQALAGIKHFVELKAGERFATGPFELVPTELPHPNGVSACRIEAGGRSVVYATDAEHGQLDDIDPRLVELARDVDLLIHDAQYSIEEYTGKHGPSRKGWGHSTWNEAVRAAELCGARKLALFHHDPTRDDDAVAAIEEAARELFPGAFAARDNAVISL